ncbi:hypothetical protein DIQ79_28410 [Mycolicibacterium smegmatis]|uniref:Uncharacterized protein n=1 Tax=Mycolicibacterium smegmatis (strain ATCC 700084 / mc(2)155) TaxID=246196 RepID=A0QQL5_MYCS2|nr:hypothetical protein MSMEG_0799 [Mycolicibacterium smegmatis MC2 155]TBM41121.1 hypothetical protein DIQ86_24255 [Mycolicibacterium smegmatis]TBH29159.1 hypothetical protein EYS45_28195 [Mycolicibacterium smegmatis MC2 155]TBM45991.1 hypothetical protein DIQ85_29630 [Mycolicibacterium smegmatis]TBM55797.1 hypothetical protein DIQ83_28385 [Mycolicibacterium smegmatis]
MAKEQRARAESGAGDTGATADKAPVAPSTTGSENTTASPDTAPVRPPTRVPTDSSILL